MIAVLTRLFGMHNLSMAEDVVQDAFLKATQTWKFKTVPDNPSAWLMQVAKNKALDILRRESSFRKFSKELISELPEKTELTVDQFFHEHEIADSQRPNPTYKFLVARTAGGADALLLGIRREEDRKSVV